MTRILKEVLAKDEHVCKNTDSYIDIIVREEAITVEEIAAHLRQYGLESKPPEGLEDGRVLELSIHRNANRELIFSHGNELLDPEELEGLSHRQLFSVCGQLVGHHPICGWLRVTCSFEKKESEGEFWDDYVSGRAEGIIKDILCRLKKRGEDPVIGHWDGVVQCQ